MAKMIQVRNVPERVHREVVKRAKRKGQSLSDYVKRLIEHDVERPPVDEVLDRILSRPAVDLDRPVAEYIREGRDEGAL